jgi:hypothetical protein
MVALETTINWSDGIIPNYRDSQPSIFWKHSFRVNRLVRPAFYSMSSGEARPLGARSPTDEEKFNEKEDQVLSLRTHA